MVEIVTFGVSFRRSSLFMIKKKYHNLDILDIDLTKKEWHDVLDPADRLVQLEGQVGEEGLLEKVEADLSREVEDEIVNIVNEFDPPTPMLMYPSSLTLRI